MLLAIGVIVAESAPIALAAFSLALLVSLLFTRGTLRVVCVAMSAIAVALACLPLSMLAATIRASDAQVLAATGRSVAAGETAARAPFEFFPQLERGPEGPIRSSLGLPVTCRDGSRLGLDLYRVPSAGPRPAVILIYGGAWRFGTRANMRPYALELAALGYTAIAVDYRHAPQHRYPTQVDDVRAALATIARNARAWDVDPGSVALLGESAGAELALLAAYEPGPLHARAVVAYYAPLDLAGGYRDPPRPDPADIRNILRTYLGGSPDLRSGGIAAHALDRRHARRAGCDCVSARDGVGAGGGGRPRGVARIPVEQSRIRRTSIRIGRPIRALLHGALSR